ncbi:hypothetical protein [Methanogenium organophilum]|uniref:Uncharacterized protein n=1 Tax=Methanogenium organophilum TaxID=2199 RepID=A0A9X9S4N9_METOG|nr:hypothetical protein [Methanogenium organophilum]WAI01410.1 hypothetical protein OU421_00615 [Methanogenium organophilum]
MSPRTKFRKPDAPPLSERSVHTISQDMLRKREQNRHHPYNHRHPHPAHHPWKHPDLPPIHTPHSHPHEEELGPHTNQPGPIRFSKRRTQTGRKTLISDESRQS